MTLAEELRELEERLLDSDVRRDSEAVGALLAEEFVEYGSSGRVFDRAAILAALGEEMPQRLWLEDFEARELAAGVVLVTYRSYREAGGSALRSSVWVRRAGKWRMVFHQGTRVGE